MNHFFKRFIIGVVFMLFAASPAFAVNGVMLHFGEQRVLHVWGTPYQMGFAQGYFLAEDIVFMMEVYTFPPEGESPLLYEAARQFVLGSFFYEEDLTQEAQGMYDGMLAAGIPKYVPVLGRDFDVNDLLVFTTLYEITGLACATLIGWDSTTLLDPELAGSLVVAHNLDYIMEPEDGFAAGERGLIISYSPSDPNQQRFINITWPGFLGLMVGMNESGIGLMVNMGRYEVPFQEMDLDPPLEPDPWIARKAVALRLVQDGEPETINDVLDYYQDMPQFAPSIIQLFGARGRSDPPTAVLEINNKTSAVRTPDEDLWVRPDLFLVLNWEDKLLPQRDTLAAKRYWGNVYLLYYRYHREIGIPMLWGFLKINSGVAPRSLTLFSVIFLPEAMRLGLSFWSDYDNIPAENNIWYDFQDLFPPPTYGEPDFGLDDTQAEDDAQDDAQPGDDSADEGGGSGSEDGDSGACACGRR